MKCCAASVDPKPRFAEEPERAGCDNAPKRSVTLREILCLQKNPKEQGVTTLYLHHIFLEASAFAEEPERAGCDNLSSFRGIICILYLRLQKNPKEQGVTT